ncbi:MAG: sn-glycerol-3-phosphate ABC transporter ATP-binding protein UgpC [Planctomycetota bacterium]
MASITLSEIWKSYDETSHAVRGVSLEIADGEFLVLVGPSGCGKSTTLRMIAGLEDATRGSVRIADRDVTREHPRDRDIAMVFQNYALYPHMNVYRNMSFALKMRKVARAEIDRRVRHAADLLGLNDLLQKKPRQLSGGQRQRVALGRAIVREPKAFLFDEPLSNLDAALRTSTRAELKSLHERLRTTTVYVTHDQEEALTLGDRVAVMRGGTIQQCGSPFDVFNLPVNRFVAGFIGTPKMNFIDGTIERQGDAATFLEPGDGGARLKLSSQLSKSERIRSGQRVTIGIRPQALSEAGASGSPAEGQTLTITPSLVEPLGDQMDVHGVTPAGSRIVARIRAHDGVPVGSPTTLSVETDRLLLFESDSDGRNLGLPVDDS